MRFLRKEFIEKEGYCLVFFQAKRVLVFPKEKRLLPWISQGKRLLVFPEEKGLCTEKKQLLSCIFQRKRFPVFPKEKRLLNISSSKRKYLLKRLFSFIMARVAFYPPVSQARPFIRP